MLQEGKSALACVSWPRHLWCLITSLPGGGTKAGIPLGKAAAGPQVLWLPHGSCLIGNNWYTSGKKNGRAFGWDFQHEETFLAVARSHKAKKGIDPYTATWVGCRRNYLLENKKPSVFKIPLFSTAISLFAEGWLRKDGLGSACVPAEHHQSISAPQRHPQSPSKKEK